MKKWLKQIIRWFEKQMVNYERRMEINEYADTHFVTYEEAKKACEELSSIHYYSHYTTCPCIGCMELHCSTRGKKIIYCKDANS